MLVVVALSVRERKWRKKEAKACEVWIFYLLRYNICMNGLLFAMTALLCFAEYKRKTKMYDSDPRLILQKRISSGWIYICYSFCMHVHCMIHQYVARISRKMLDIKDGKLILQILMLNYIKYVFLIKI